MTYDVAREDRQLTSDDFRRARLDALQAVSAAAVDMLTASTRGERDRLLSASMIGFLISAASAMPTRIKVPAVEFVVSASVVRWGTFAIICYYLISFGCLAWMDWRRWNATLGPSAASIADWSEKLSQHMERVGTELQGFGTEAMDRHNEYVQKRTEHDRELAKLKKVQQASRPGSKEWVRASEQMSSLYEALHELSAQYDLRPYNEIMLPLAQSHSDAYAALAKLEDATRLSTRFGSVHLWFSIGISGLIGLSALAAVSGLITLFY